MTLLSQINVIIENILSINTTKDIGFFFIGITTTENAFVTAT